MSTARNTTLGTQKRVVALDMVSTKRPVIAPPVVSSTVVYREIPEHRGLDAVHAEPRSFLSQWRKASWSVLFLRLLRKSQLFLRHLKHFISRFVPAFAPHKLLYGSIASGIAFGMVSMALIEHAFGPGVFARSSGVQTPAAEVVAPAVAENNTPPEASDGSDQYDPSQDVFFEYFGEVTEEKYEQNIRDMVRGYPIEAMLPYIFQQDRSVTAFLIGIAKKESNWGKRVPVLDDQDCFNYWGYRGVRRMMGTGRHTCFNSRKDAVQTVAARLNTLIHSEKLNTPEKMIIWKCGFSCQGHSRESVKKWISDVDLYFSELNDE